MNMHLERFKQEIIPLRPKLLVQASRMLEDGEEAEDVVQEVLLRLWTLREQLTEVGNPAGFAMQTTKNICIDKLRARKPTCEVEDIYIGSNEQTPYSTAETNDSTAIVREIINRLPGLQKQIICMRDIEGYELSEIAEITGTQATAVSMNLSRARKKVRDEYIAINNYRGRTE